MNARMIDNKCCSGYISASAVHSIASKQHHLTACYYSIILLREQR